MKVSNPILLNAFGASFQLSLVNGVLTVTPLSGGGRPLFLQGADGRVWAGTINGVGGFVVTETNNGSEQAQVFLSSSEIRGLRLGFDLDPVYQSDCLNTDTSPAPCVAEAVIDKNGSIRLIGKTDEQWLYGNHGITGRRYNTSQRIRNPVLSDQSLGGNFLIQTDGAAFIVVPSATVQGVPFYRALAENGDVLEITLNNGSIVMSVVLGVPNAILFLLNPTNFKFYRLSMNGLTAVFTPVLEQDTFGKAIFYGDGNNYGDIPSLPPPPPPPPPLCSVSATAPIAPLSTTIVFQLPPQTCSVSATAPIAPLSTTIVFSFLSPTCSVSATAPTAPISSTPIPP